MSSQPAVGDVIAARYEVRALIREAPAYTAYRAFDREIEVEVALWWMHAELFPDELRRSSFVGAVVDTRELKHPNLRRMFDAGSDDAGLFATAQLDTDDGLLPGPGDGRIVEEGDLVHYAASVSGALEAGHAAGHVHGRLSASEVVHVAGLIKVSGVGLYREVDPGAAEALWQGEERFVSPEVRGGAMATPASDVYSLARLLAELATGQSPEELEELIDLIEQHKPELANAFEAALSPSPDDRPQTPAALLAEIQSVLIDERIPTGETALPSSGSDVVLRTKEDGASGWQDGGFGSGPDLVTVPERGPRGKPARAAPHAKTLVDGKPVSVSVNGAPRSGPSAKTISEAEELPVVRRDDIFDVEETVGEDDEPEFEPDETIDDRDAAPAGFDPDQTVDDRAMSRLPPLGFEPGSRQLPLSAPSDPTPPGAPPAPEPTVPAKRTSDPSIRFVSKKPQTEPDAKSKTPLVPAIERPEMKPVLRPISSLTSSQSHPPGALGRYAPPRDAAPPEPAPRSPAWPYVLLAVATLAVIGAGIWFVALRSSGDSEEGQDGPGLGAGADAAPKPTSTPLQPKRRAAESSSTTAPCPDTMLVGRNQRFCIDRYESPGRGRMPETGISLAQSKATCLTRGRRLCKEREWEWACRGEGDSSYPYGSTYRRGLCNTDTGRAGSVVVAGEFAGCKSAAGALDMSGNVAEWVQGGIVKGGSAVDRSDGRCSRKRRVRAGQEQGQGFSDVGFRCCKTVESGAP